MKGDNTRKMTAGHLRSFERLQHKLPLKTLEYYFPITSAQLCRLRAKNMEVKR